jgi:hypothetical protein
MEVTMGSGSNIYGGVDWVSSGMSASEDADLMDPSAWLFAEPLGNPISMRTNDVRAIFDVGFRGDYQVRRGPPFLSACPRVATRLSNGAPLCLCPTVRRSLGQSVHAKKPGAHSVFQSFQCWEVRLSLERRLGPPPLPKNKCSLG